MIDLKKNIDSLCSIAKRLGNSDLFQVALFLRQRIYQPDSYVVLLGESCSGKSTLINSIIGQGILPVSSVPSTGAITEVFIDEEVPEPAFVVINKNATMERLTFSNFCELAQHPDANVQRLRASLPIAGLNMAGVRLFDTPGYGSLIEEHDEVLVDFLPNCDAIIYTVSYRIGVQETDHEFLRKLKELARSDIPVYLVINRCPSTISLSDRRIAEIYRNVTALLSVQEMPLYTIPTAQVQDGIIQSQALNDLRNQICIDLNASNRKEDLYYAFLSYLLDLTNLLRADIERQIRDLKMSAEDAQYMKAEMKKLSAQFQHVIDGIVKPGFERIRNNLPICVANSRQNIENYVCAEIEKQSAASKEEMIAYTNSHLLPFQARKESDEIKHYLTVELEAIDEEVNNYLNTVVINFERDIELRFAGSTFKAGAGAAKNVAGKLLNSGLLKYFGKFGGRGGAGAGMANAASHALKKAGDMFGHTFSRETHNTVKHVMKKIGLTSTKTLGAAVTGILELLTLALDYGTWKPLLISKVKKGLKHWEDEILTEVQTDLDKLKQENIDSIKEIAKTYSDAFSVDDNPQGDATALEALLQELDTIEKELS